MNKRPMIIALNGIPGSGKTAVQSVLEKRFKIKPIDDGWLIRRHCMDLFGLTEDDVTSQEGKKRHTVIQGVTWQNRKVLGEYGAILEEKFGALTMPLAALNRCEQSWPEHQSAWDGYSFGSVRRGQAEAYAGHGGIVIEIVRPGVEHSGNIWDTYDQRWVNYTFINDSNSLETLEMEFVAFFTSILDRKNSGGTKFA